jgi:heptosyltransferase III
VKIKNILIIMQRSNGDVLLSISLINQLFVSLKPKEIDLLVNLDTLPIAKTLPNIHQIHTFSYQEKRKNKFRQEKKIVKKIYKKYDLSINLTASDRSVIYALLASKKAISAVEKDQSKSWWKKILLKHHYIFDSNSHILINNLKTLRLLGIEALNQQIPPSYTLAAANSIQAKLLNLKITKFIIFHPSAQYEYKVYDKKLRKDLLHLLDTLNIPVIVSGGENQIDKKIKALLPKLKNVYDFIGETSIDEYIILSSLSKGYIGMDTLNMHIAASQNKRIFAIFGPTNINVWSPWSNDLQTSATQVKPIQTYGNITIFQADMPCVACGEKGCNNNGVVSECLKNISPHFIFKEIKEWLLSYSL